MSSHKVPGLNVQWPWSKHIVEGKKTIETRTYPIPASYIDVDLALIQTPGPEGKKNGILNAEIVAIIRLKSCFKYKNENTWRKDLNRHLVKPSSKQFNWSKDKEKWGWEIELVKVFDYSIKAPKKKGILFTLECEIPK